MLLFSSLKSLDLKQAVIRFAALILAAPLLILAFPQEAKANIVCGVNSAVIDFGGSASGTGTIAYTCTNYGNPAQTITMCVELGIPSYPGSTAQPAMINGGNALNYNVYRDPALTQTWVQTQPLTQSQAIPSGNGVTISGSIQFYGLIASGQSVPPTNYTAAFYNVQLGFIVGGGSSCQVSSPPLSGLQFTLSIYATVTNNCIITAQGTADLGIVTASPSPVFGSTAITVNCPSGTAYNVGLAPSNGNSAGLGVLTGTGSNSDQPPYQLHAISNAGPVWGNTASLGAVGNGVSGTGNGSDQSYPVYVTMPDSNTTPDTYRDTVTITIHF